MFAGKVFLSGLNDKEKYNQRKSVHQTAPSLSAFFKVNLAIFVDSGYNKLIHYCLYEVMPCI